MGREGIELDTGEGNGAAREVPQPRTPEVRPSTWERTHANRGSSALGDDEAGRERHFGSCKTTHTRSSGDWHSVGSNDRAADQAAQSLTAGSNTCAEHATWVGAPKGSLRRGQSVGSFSATSMSIFEEVRGKVLAKLSSGLVRLEFACVCPVNAFVLCAGSIFPFYRG